MVYLAISYSPISRATNTIWRKQDDKRSRLRDAEKYDN
jgi:hypothetical protein